MTPRRRSLVGGLAAAVGAAVLALAPATPAAAATALTLPNAHSHGIDLQDLTTVDGTPDDHWLLDAAITSTAVFVPGPSGSTPDIDSLARTLHVRILLPNHYRQDDPATRYPVLYLLHGGADTYASWTDKGEVRSTVGGVSAFNGIVVMPEGGRSGWYSDWQGETDGHFRPLWETFHVDQLVPWIDANLNTVADRSGRAIAGLSMGGLGAMRYAARHPGVFSAAASLSGAVEMRYEPFQDVVSNSMWSYGATIVNQGLFQTQYRVTTGEAPEAEETSRLNILFGPSSAPVAPETRPGWPTMNPVELAQGGALAPYTGKLALYAGDSTSAGQEKDIGLMTDTLHQALNERGVTHRYCRGYGQHDWPYWQNDLQDFLQYAYGATPATCTTNGADTATTADDWALVTP